jgi:hypothetical protein
LIQATRLHHRDNANGLFIGTGKLLLVLMNPAPAELLHPLTMQHFNYLG